MIENSAYNDWSTGWYCFRAKPKMEMLASQTLSTLKDVEVFLPRTIRPKKERLLQFYRFSLDIYLLNLILSLTYAMFILQEAFLML